MYAERKATAAISATCTSNTSHVAIILTSFAGYSSALAGRVNPSVTPSCQRSTWHCPRGDGLPLVGDLLVSVLAGVDGGDQAAAASCPVGRCRHPVWPFRP